jgi:TatD DNase family protein
MVEPLMVIDSHCHLDHQYFTEGPDAVLARARTAGVRAFVAVGVGSQEVARQTVVLARREADVVATVGVHPHEARSFVAVWPQLEPLFDDPRVVAVGETGLDFHYDHSPRHDQVDAFCRQIAFARGRHLPLVVHTREAPHETLDVLASEGARDVGGVIHCFSEDREFASRALDLGFDLSFSGIVTFTNAKTVHDVARWAPEDRILVETDCPYLAPVPLRGKRCEPAHVVHTAARMAELRSIPIQRLEAITSANACRRFGVQLAAAVRACESSQDGQASPG